MGMKKTHEKRAFILVCELGIIQVWWADKGEVVARWYVCNQFHISKQESCINKELQWLLSVAWAVTSLQNVDDIPKGTDLLCWKEGAPQRKRWLWKTAHLGELEIPTLAKCGQLQAANGSVSAIVLIFYSILFYSHFLCLVDALRAHFESTYSKECCWWISIITIWKQYHSLVLEVSELHMISHSPLHWVSIYICADICAECKTNWNHST